MKSNLKTHILSIHEKVKPYKCEICDYKCLTMEILKIHLISFHKGMKPFKCNICEYEFSSKYTLNNHVSTIHEGSLSNAKNVTMLVTN